MLPSVSFSFTSSSRCPVREIESVMSIMQCLGQDTITERADDNERDQTGLCNVCDKMLSSLRNTNGT